MQAGSGEVSVDQSLVMPRPPRGGGIGFRVFFESCAGDRALPLLGVATVHEPVERAELELSPPRERFGSSVGDSLDASLGLGAALLGGGSAVLAVSVTEVPLGSLQRALSRDGGTRTAHSALDCSVRALSRYGPVCSWMGLPGLVDLCGPAR
ncbi:unnamed protein product [Prorocentrum cordatum]|uniref:RNA 3'-terminal-phosphate cyclase (ATP) n=1 Tax=Prorocentrum cordatum TaxID=2364126 RepID=A0ABN9U4A7_9DINO|nr:unnamed protein product [Polarella glacialis]